jgi:hypothetical protein
MTSGGPSSPCRQGALCIEQPIPGSRRLHPPDEPGCRTRHSITHHSDAATILTTWSDGSARKYIGGPQTASQISAGAETDAGDADLNLGPPRSPLGAPSPNQQNRRPEQQGRNGSQDPRLAPLHCPVVTVRLVEAARLYMMRGET